MPAHQTLSKCTVRKYLTAREIEKLMDHARKHSRYGHRDATMILVTYRHGLRASEVCDLQWHQVELDPAACTSAGPRTARIRPSHPGR
jgi:integrase